VKQILGLGGEKNIMIYDWAAQAEKKSFHSFILSTRVSSESVPTRTQLKTYRAEIARAKLARVRFARAKLIRVQAFLCSPRLPHIYIPSSLIDNLCFAYMP
jgi:hypothetical protein